MAPVTGRKYTPPRRPDQDPPREQTEVRRARAGTM
jgi:hypothetical protein